MTMAGFPKDLRRFLDGRADVEAVVQRVGHQTYDVVFVDGAGEWTHWVVESTDDRATWVQLELTVSPHRLTDADSALAQC